MADPTYFNRKTTLINIVTRYSLRILHKCTCLSTKNKQDMESNNYFTAEKVYLASKLYRCISRVSICSGLNTFCTYFEFWYFHIKAMLPKK